MFSPIRTRRTFEEAVEQIAEAIQAGDLRTGDRLPPERTLAARMEISRPTLREAIRILADAGVVDVKPGPRGGAFVRSEHIPSELLERHRELRASEVSGVLEARRLLEPGVAELAALNGSESDFEVMRRTIELQRESADDRSRFLQLDMRFHLAMARATGNATAIALMRLLMGRLEIARDMAIRMPDDAEWAIAIHERTLAAIVDGDRQRIAAAMDEHLGYLERMWEERGPTRARALPARRSGAGVEPTEAWVARPHRS